MLYKSLHTIVRLFTLFILLTSGASPARAGDATLPEWDFHFPMDLPTFVSGSFGELRANHFHSGVDFTTGGKTGLPLYAIDEGYVARIGV
ncbi:MAG TPA: M23 family peptidase, partial [Bacteroidales bacterium]|nr:M23 family peptidase [Bacteroidales bacterium]